MNLKEKILKKGLKMSWIALEVGISQPLLSMYLSGKRTMPVKIEAKIKKLIK